ncbi:Pyrrolo-quinoline quinone [Burkholderiales bacterium 8X]|nr:Pyrrolo-quinoline quinone [Burkholderiales bacterium 8X]
MNRSRIASRAWTAAGALCLLGVAQAAPQVVAPPEPADRRLAVEAPDDGDRSDAFDATAERRADRADWTSAGSDLSNTRYQANESRIDARSVGALQLRWSIATEGDVTAHPAVEGDFVYFPDSKGWLYKLRRATGAVVWKKPISDYTGIAGDFARATPAIVGNALILGNQSGKFLQAFGQPAPQGAHVFAVDKRNGRKLWSRRVDSTAYSTVTQSAVVSGGLVLVGVASNEELVAGFVPKSQGWQFNFRGSVMALDVRTGAQRWRTYTVPAGYSGGSVWGSTVAVDLARNQLYVATGNNFSVPTAVLDCLNGRGTPAACMSPDNHPDSVLAMALDTGRIRWARRAVPYDAWNVGCGLNVPGLVVPPNDNCPVPQGPDWDFAQGPMLVDAARSGVELVGAGQKSGKFWALNPRNGNLLWSTQVGPPGLSGGLQWGSATDGRRIYVAVANSGPTSAGQNPLPWRLKDGSVTTAGGWAALDAASGDVLWTTKDPRGSRAEGPVSAAADVVFGCNMDAASGTFYALDARTGAPLWSFASGGACTAGASIAGGMVFWGSGMFNGAGPKRFFAFGL